MVLYGTLVPLVNPRGTSGRSLGVVVTMSAVSADEARSRDAACRPMRADAAKNRLRILRAAEEVFASEGVGAPVDAVAERAGVGVGTLYRHFPTKETLFEAIVVTRLEDLVGALDCAGEAEDPGAAFFSFLKRFAAEASRKRDLFDALGAAGVDVKSDCTELFERLELGLKRLLDRAVAATVVRPDVTTTDVIGLVVGACHAADQPGLGLSSSDRMVEVVCDGLRLRR